MGETNPLPPGFHSEKAVRTVDWADPLLVRIERLRLLSDPGCPWWDVSYCYGRLTTGEKVRVDLPFSQLPKHRVTQRILAWARHDKVYAKGLGIFEALSCLC